MKQMTATTRQDYKSITLQDIYLQYPFKKNILTNTKVIPVPYIKKDDIVLNEQSLDFKEWSNIISRYIELCREVLLSGNVVELPFRMGTLQIKKIKLKKFLDKKQSKDVGKKVYSAKPNPDGYYLKLYWDRNYKICFLQFKWHWKITVNRTLIREAYKRCENDFTYINKFKDV